MLEADVTALVFASRRRCRMWRVQLYSIWWCGIADITGYSTTACRSLDYGKSVGREWFSGIATYYFTADNAVFTLITRVQLLSRVLLVTSSWAFHFIVTSYNAGFSDRPRSTEGNIPLIFGHRLDNLLIDRLFPLGIRSSSLRTGVFSFSFIVRRFVCGRSR